MTVPAQRAAVSPTAGPASQEVSRYSARPPSKGRIGRRLKAHSTRLAPTAAGQRPLAAAVRARAARRFPAGPASTAASSLP